MEDWPHAELAGSTTSTEMTSRTVCLRSATFNCACLAHRAPAVIRRRGVGLAGLAPLVVCALLGMAGCVADQEPVSARATSALASCDDADEATARAPEQLLEDLGAGKEPRVLGEGRLYFLAPAEGSWGDSTWQEGGETALKVGLWVNDTRIPDIEVRSADGALEGHAEVSPTADGLPGFLPTGVSFPSGGCWRVTARLGGDVAEISVLVP